MPILLDLSIYKYIYINTYVKLFNGISSSVNSEKNAGDFLLNT